MSLPLSSTARVQCAECLRLMRAGARQASTSTFSRRGEGSSDARAGSWQPRAQNVDPQRRRPDAARPRQAVAGQRGAQQLPARSWSKPEASKTKFKEKDSEKKLDEPVNVNFSQGSALAAFLSKAPSIAPRPQAASSARLPRSSSPNASRQPTLSQKQAAQAVKRPRPPLRSQARRPTRKVEISQMTSVNNLSRILGLKLRRLQHLMERMGMSDTRPDKLLNAEDATLVAIELGYDTAIVDEEKLFDIHPSPPSDDPTELPLRPPIVTIMGHVDHGKTSLLDALRSTKVAAGEAGGITQHIGAFSVPLNALLSGEMAQPSSSSTGSLTFLDTPGHAAFAAMRSRGASVTDVVVLVVAADDGVKPQTEEVINLIKNEDVGIVIAITKCDKSGIDISRVHNELLTHGLEVEPLGGDIPCVQVSAHTGDGLPELVETINAIAEVRDLRAEKTGLPSEGRIIESRVEKGRGNVATVIVARGTLHKGATIIAGTAFAKVRQLTSSNGEVLETAGPGTPIEVTGWKDLPEAGDEVLEATSEEDAKRAVDNRVRRKEQQRTLGDMEVINEKRRIEAEAAALLKEMQAAAVKAGDDPATVTPGTSAYNSESGIKELRLIIKSDFNGTLEAVSGSLSGIGNSEAKVKVVSTGVGDVTDSDLAMAKAVDGVVVGFNIKAHRQTMATAEALNVPILLDNVIYRLIDDIKARVIDMLPKLYDSRVLGEATILQTFKYTIKGRQQKMIAGCRVGNGTITKKAKIRLSRGKETIFKGNVESLKHLKNDVDEVKKGTECGIAIEGFADYREGDILQSYEDVERVRTL